MEEGEGMGEKERSWERLCSFRNSSEYAVMYSCVVSLVIL